MKWLLYLRIAIVVIQIIKELSEGKKPDAGKIVTKITPVLPDKLKGNLAALTQDDIDGIQEAFLAFGEWAGDIKDKVD